MNATAIGMPYPRNCLGQNGVCFEMSPKSPPKLIFVMPHPTPKETRDINFGQIEMGLNVIDGIIFITYKIGDKMNGEAPFHVRLYDPLGITIDTTIDFPESSGLLMELTLVDSSTNITKVIRIIGSGNAFAHALMDAIRKQYESDFDPDAYDEKLEHIYKYNSSFDLWRKSQHKFKIKETV
jgi:hypothetical protein